MAAPTSYPTTRLIAKSDTVNFDGTIVSTTGQYQTTTNTEPIPCDAIMAGGAGIAVVVMENGQTSDVTLVAGELYPVRAIRINSTTTTATVMQALYQTP